MLKQIITGFLVVVLLASFLFPSVNKKRKIKKGPPGTIWLRDTIYMDECEVRNLDYLEYIWWLKNNYGKDEPYIITKNLPDTLLWKQPGSYSEEIANSYFSSPAYRHFPVTCISYQQAKDYCQWRTERVKEGIKYGKEHDKKVEFPNHFEDFYYRLPTIEEWEYAASGGMDTAKYLFGYEFLNDSEQIVRVNVREGDGNTNGLYGTGFPKEAEYGLENNFGFYSMIGNVAEMSNEKGISKGGSWNHYLDQCHIRDSIVYSVPATWLGFRCVCVVKYKTGYDAVTGQKKK